MSNENRPPATPEQIDRARKLHCSDDINVDDDAVVSVADEGVWVQAWVWVPNPE